MTDSQGQTVQSYKPKPWLTATSPTTADKLTNLMLSVVNSPNGTGVAARIPGMQVAGKTGTAQTGWAYIETWFVAFAPVPDPEIAVAVLVENQPTGGRVPGWHDRRSHRQSHHPGLPPTREADGAVSWAVARPRRQTGSTYQP